MSKYLVKERSFIEGKIYEVGDTVEFTGKAGKNLTPYKECDQVINGQQPTSEELQELEDLRKIYEEMFGEAPHKNTSAKTLKEKIDARRKELGV